MAIVIARALRDGDVLVMGTNAAIPLAAARTAQGLHAPRVTVMIGAHGTIDPTAGVAPLSGGDEAFLGGRFTTSLASGVGDQLRGLADVIFLGALQVDRVGRCNLAVIGDHARPLLRGPGTVGLSLIATVKRTIMFFTRHDRRMFVEAVDFLGAEGLRADGGGIELIVTPLAVLGPTPGRDRLDVVTIHPPVSFEELQDRTGFALDRAAATTTPEPSARELAALRATTAGTALAGMVLE